MKLAECLVLAYKKMGCGIHKWAMHLAKTIYYLLMDTYC